jgi:hypothetical protein
MMKSVSAEILLKRIGTSLGSLHLSTATQVQPNTKTHSFRTEENNVLNHTLDHVGQYYRIPNDEKKIYLYGGLPKSYQIQTTALRTYFGTILICCQKQCLACFSPHFRSV